MEACKIDRRAEIRRNRVVIVVRIVDAKRARLLAQMLPSETHFTFFTFGKKGAGVRVDTGRPMGRIEVGLEMGKGWPIAKRIGRVGSARSRVSRAQKGTRRSRVGAG